jgi:4-amino-4-deoxy-L-arabinose transferase-like glycosyltransferase
VTTALSTRLKLSLTAAVALLILGGALRIIGMTWGLPYQLQPDEPTLFINAWERWDGVAPTLLGEYSPLYLYVLMAQREFIYRAFGPETPQLTYFFFGRWNSILLNLLVAAAAFRLGKLADGRKAGLTLMLLLAVDPLAVLDQGWVIKADSFGWLLVLSTLWVSLMAQRQRSWRWLGLAFMLAIAATVAKYNMGLVFLAPLWVLLDWRMRKPLRSALLLAGAIILVTLLSWATLRYFWADDIAPRFEHCARSWGDEMPPEIRARTWEFLPCSPFLAFLRYGVPFYDRSDFLGGDSRIVLEHILRTQRQHFGHWQWWFALVMIGGGLWYRRGSPQQVGWVLVALLAGVGFFLFFTLMGFYPNRQYYVITLAVTLGLAMGLAALYHPRRPWLYGLLIVWLCLPNLIQDVRGRWNLQQPDTRAVTADFLLTQARRGESVVVEYDWVEFGQQYGGFPAPQGYFNVMGVNGLYDLDPTRFYRDGIYYVVVDERGLAYGSGHYHQVERLPDSWELILDLTDDRRYFGPDRQIYRTFRPQTILEADFGGVASLHGYDLRPSARGFLLWLYWHAQQTNLPPYSVFIHLIDSATGEAVLRADGPPSRLTEQWERYEWIFDERLLDLSQVPAGRYGLKLGLYDPVTGQRLPVNGEPSGVLTLQGIEWGGPQDQG